MAIQTEIGLLYNSTQFIQNESFSRKWQETIDFYNQHEDIISKATSNAYGALERFGGDENSRIDTSSKLVFLWVQAKLEQRYAAILEDNPISGFSVAAGVGTHISIYKDSPEQFCFSAGANREHDLRPIANAHAETSAIERLRGIISPILVNSGGKMEIDMISITGFPPRASCRGEIFKNRASDNTLVAIFSDEGDVNINTISELFPTKFEQIDIEKVPQNLLRLAEEAADLTIKSPYEKEEALADYGVAISTEEGEYEVGYASGEDAFHSNTATIDALGKHIRKNRHKFLQSLGKTEQELDVDWKPMDGEAIQKINQVVYVYKNGTHPFYPSGKDRQQLTRLSDSTEVYIVEADTQIAFKTTRGELIPGAFVKQD